MEDIYWQDPTKTMRPVFKDIFPRSRRPIKAIFFQGLSATSNYTFSKDYQWFLRIYWQGPRYNFSGVINGSLRKYCPKYQLT